MPYKMNRFTIPEENKELMRRFAKRDRKRKVAFERVSKTLENEPNAFYKHVYEELQRVLKETPKPYVHEDVVYEAWEKHIKFLESQKF